MFSHFRSLWTHWGISCLVWFLPTHSHQNIYNPSVFHLSKSSCHSKLQRGCVSCLFGVFVLFFFLLMPDFCVLPVRRLKAASYADDLGKTANNSISLPATPLGYNPELPHLTIKTYSKLHFNNCLNLYKESNFLVSAFKQYL